jgi:glycosyltransferase involved in cell wall biosynthesis
MRQLKILQISARDVGSGGGAEGSAWHLFTAFRARGHRSWLAVGKKNSTDPDVFEIPRSLSRTGRGVLGAVDRALSWAGSRPACGWRFRRLRDALLRSQGSLWRCLGVEDFAYPGSWRLLDNVPCVPDIVHAHNLHAGYFDLRSLPRLSQRARLIVNLRDMWLLTGHCAYTSGCERWQGGCGHCPHLDTYPAINHDMTAFNWRRKTNLYAQSRLYVTTPSVWLAGQVARSMLNGPPHRMIPNGIDLSLFFPYSRGEARGQLGLPQHSKVVLFSAHTPFKDYETMTATIERLQPPGGDELLFLCLGREGADTGIGAGVLRYPGFVDDTAQMALYYSASDIYIHAAKDEVFGKAIAEAMACGLPVVATAVGGIPEVIGDEGAGFLVSPGHSEEMAACVQQLLENPALARSVGEAAAKRARMHFDLNRQVDAFLEWYEAILAGEQKQSDDR